LTVSEGVSGGGWNGQKPTVVILGMVAQWSANEAALKEVAHHAKQI